MKRSIILTLMIIPIAILTLALTQNYVAYADESISQSNSNSNSSEQNSNSDPINTSQNNDSAQSSSSTTDQQQPQPRQYDRVISTKKVNFDTIITKVKKVYMYGAYNTKESNVKEFGNSISLKQKWVKVSELQTTRTGTYAHIFYKQKDKGWINQDAFDSSAFKLNNVPLIPQLPQLPTGCEITAVTMMINYATGKKYSKTYMANRMPRSSNPNKGFIGNPYSKSGWYIYPPALMKLVKQYTGSSVNLTGKSTNYLKDYLQKHHHPIVIYVAHFHGFPNHAITMTGFTKDRVYYNNPWTGKRSSMEINKFNLNRRHDAKRAISY